MSILLFFQLAVRITELASRLSSYSDRWQRYIIVASSKAHCRSERPVTIENSIWFGYEMTLRNYCSAIQPTTVWDIFFCIEFSIWYCLMRCMNNLRPKFG